MRKRILWFLTTVILCGTTAVALCSCSDNDDNPAAQTPLGDKIVGHWYAETPKQVTIGAGDNAVECAKAVLVGSFDADGEGFWSYILVDKQNRAIQPVGKDGEPNPYFANCHYSVTGNTVNVELTANYLPTSQMEWTFNYNGTCLQTKYEDRMIDLLPITTGEDAMYQEWMRQLGFGAEMVDFNINDKDITAENWRQTEGIYVYDGVGADVTDEKGRTGYTLVALPWYNGTKQTNLPEGFCDDITPEMGWEWVANYCGNRSIVNNNFFALYNKYTGILRFFYYMPQGTSTGNDHVWQVSMTDNLATHTTIPYGVPNDRSLSNKAAINQTGQGTFMDYITPWVDYRSNDGLIVPNDGWWAFDVDLSLTRPEAISNDDNIKLQMRSWDTNHTSLYSTVEANIDGEMKGSFEGQTKTPLIASSSKGLFGRVGDLVKLGTKITNTVKDIYSGNAVGAIKGGVDLAKNGASLASGKTKASGGATSATFDGTFEGTINMMMNGTINTDGVIQGSQPTVGVASPTFYLKDFDTKNSLLGQGVWNIKKTPMVYAVNSQNTVDFWPENPNIFAANWLFFDPSSVEVELNPNVFPEDEIEWIQVDAIAGARKEMNWKGTDPFRQAIGLKPMDEYKYEIHKYFYDVAVTHKYGADVDNYVFNFVGTGDFDGKTIDGTKFLMSYDAFETGWADFDGRKQWPRVFGCGTDDYIIEPQITCFERIRDDIKVFIEKSPFLFPAVEINVTVQVKLKSLDLPIILSRIYLPDYQYLEISDKDEAKVLEVIDRIQAKKNLSPKTKGHTQSYDFQAARINKCFKLLFGYSR